MNASKTGGARTRRWWRLLLLAPVVATLGVPWFAHARPTLFGFPFFYWYLIAWVPLGAACTAIVYFKTRHLI
jgi:hypothetical protein